MKIPELVSSDLSGQLCIVNSPGWFICIDRDGNFIKPVIRCKCGKFLNIKGHHVHTDGRVTASFLHPECGWHEFIELENWSGQEFLPEN